MLTPVKIAVIQKFTLHGTSRWNSGATAHCHTSMDRTKPEAVLSTASRREALRDWLTGCA